MAAINVYRALGAGLALTREEIDTARDHEIRYWSARLGCSTDELKRAIRIVGRSIARVRAYVGCHRRQMVRTPARRLSRLAS